ncbi:ankyrin repeat domain-containing protein [Streptomyces sp. bgisy027]|uniref:ankyrin repeat domain-containing protein n=1 Tax=Streptomyces sp. bgisy027 TaxID=3413770 RepID=UPI003D7424CC
MGAGGLDDRLRSAVRAGDAEAVRDLLDKGADPDAPDADGLPVLCLAVAAYDEPVAEALVEGGSDPDLPLPDGTTPLWRAVEGGSAAVCSAVLGKEPRLRLPEPECERLLSCARSWYERGAAEELRRRTGTTGPATTIRVLPRRSSGWGRSAQASSTTIAPTGCGGGNGGRRTRTAGDDWTAVIRWNGATGRRYRAADPSSPGKDVPLYTV